ncbi:MAG: UDP-N-acetylglucosamine 2-epimerase (hydrolyzing) [Deltaproteobacteria bacterium]|nr:UDP-N-acetylglucosamine 2-epimerase (hydrolyzing) [Deltaproteobacteria bacterium]MBW1924270.1 UDP-N-acetylglucosamine 2-epimerase (hydrolyzing) [Deltaproteobacteria bacterium]
MKGVMREIEKSEQLELQLILAGGAILDRYGLAGEALVNREFAVNRKIHFMVEGENTIAMAKSAGMAVIEFSTAFENLSPDVVIIIADRFECLAIAMAAGYMNVPLAHIEGGEVSGSIDESVRHAITKLSHVHFPATKEAEQRIIKMGEDPRTVFNVGCTSLDVIADMDLNDISPIMALQQKSGVGPVVDLQKPYLLIIQHPVTTEYDQNLSHMNETLESVRALSMNSILIWPNMDAGSDGISKAIRVFREKYRPDNIHFFKSLPIEYYAPLLKNAACVVGNSSSGIREASFLGVPSVNIGTRQAGRERGKNVIDVTYKKDEIISAVHKQLDHGPYTPDYIYGDGNACRKIVEILGTSEFKIQKKISY